MFTELSRKLAAEIAALKHRKMREETGRFLIEGPRLIVEALRSRSEALRNGVEMDFAVVAEEKQEQYGEILGRLGENGIPVQTTSAKVFSRISDTVSPQGIAAVAMYSVIDAEEALARCDRFPVAAFHEISDPGNLGTIVRTADWFGSRLLLLSQGSVDAYNAKTVRSSMGSLFRVATSNYASPADLLALAEKHNLSIVAADSREGMPVQQWKPGPRSIVLFGSEAHGLPAEYDDVPRITIPAFGDAESLNLSVSHSVILSQLALRTP